MSKWRCSMGIGLLLIGAEASPDPPDARPECQRAEEWVTAHSGDLPATLKSLQPFSQDYRVRIFAALPAEKKAEIWRERLQQALDRGLTVAQRAVVHEAIDLLTPELYQRGTGFPEQWRARVRQVFTRDEAIEIFESLGPSPGGGLLPPATATTTSNARLRRPAGYFPPHAQSPRPVAVLVVWTNAASSARTEVDFAKVMLRQRVGAPWGDGHGRRLFPREDRPAGHARALQGCLRELSRSPALDRVP